MNNRYADLSPAFDGSIAITIAERDGTFTLEWSDHVANDWSEDYPTLSIALARAAVLAACGESGWDPGFRDHPKAFTRIAAGFITSQIA